MILINPQAEYPRHIGDLKLAVPSWNIGDPLPEGWVEVTPNDPQNVPENYVAYELEPAQIDGVWVRVWATREMTAQEIEDAKPENIRRRELEAQGLPPEVIEALLA